MDEQDYTEATTYFQVGPLDGHYTAADPKFQTLAEAMALELPHKHLSRLDTLGCWQGQATTSWPCTGRRRGMR